MPIKYKASDEIPYLTRYIPYSIPENTLEIENIRQMISYNMIPSEIPVNINYFIGSATSFVTELFFKNLTDNATLMLAVSYDPAIFNISANELVLNPGQTLSVIVETDNEYLNKKMYSNLLTNIIVSVTNVATGEIVVKNTSITNLPTSTLPESITVQ